MMAAAHLPGRQLGFERGQIGDWLRLFEFEPQDAALGDRLQNDVIAPNVDVIVEGFYAYLYRHDLFVSFLGDAEQVQRLRRSQRDYLLTFGVDFSDEGYFSRRLAIGMQHCRLGIPLSLFDCAYYKLGDLVMANVPARIDTAQRARLQRLLDKFLRLDMSLVTEGYSTAQIERLEATIDGMRQKLNKLRLLASTDLLTSFANRDFTLHQLEEALAQMRKHGSPPFIIMLDVDYFKKINDIYGHLTGDQVLHMVASRAKSCTRDFDTVGRYGGDELIIVLRDASSAIAARIAERIRQSVCDSAIRVQGTKIRITVSLGIAQARPSDSVDSLIQRADSALYSAKQDGRNQVVTLP